jgi:tetratricopeptide (TPR) repeat protein
MLSPEAQSLNGWLCEESNRFKDEGNKAASLSDYEVAARLYSKSLEADPTNTKSRNNRAQMLLSLSRPLDALSDATLVFKSEPSNAKAAFRAGHSCQLLGRNDEAMKWFDAALVIEPGNVSAQAMRKKLLATSPQTQTQTTVPSVKKEKISIVETFSPSQCKQESDDDVKITKPKAERLETKVARKLESITQKAKAPEVPTTPPATVYEMERVWRGLRGRADLFASYLACFKKSTFRKVKLKL